MKNQLFIIPRAARESLDHDEVQATMEGLRELGLYALPYPTVDIWVATDGYARTVFDDKPLGATRYPRRSILKWDDSGKPNPDSGEGTVREWVAEGIMTLGHTKDGKEQAIANFGEGAWVEYRNVSLEGTVPCRRYLHFEGNKHFPNQRLLLEESPVDEIERIDTANGLIMLLATRNAVKTVEHHKCAKLGIGTKKGGRKSYEYVTTITVPHESELPNAEGAGQPGVSRAPHLRRGHIRRQRFGPRHELIKRIWIEPVFVNADKGWIATRRAYNMSL